MTETTNFQIAMLQILLKIVSWIPLSALRPIGAWFGEFTYKHDKSVQKKVKKNLTRAGLSLDLAIPSMRQSGMLAMDTIWTWGSSNKRVAELCEIATPEVFDELETYIKEKRSIVLMTPHIGCYEIAPIYFYEKFLKRFNKELMVLYREPKVAFLRAFVRLSRTRPGMDPAPADLSGVRKILKAMKNGGILGCLPDQVPGRGEGVWAPFFGEPAFTMTFPMKIAKQFNSVVYVASTERIMGKGWKLYVRRLDVQLTGDALKDATTMNGELEKLICQFPEQYIWNYNRYKVPKGVKRPEGNH